MQIPAWEVIYHVKMKTRRAQQHFDALIGEVDHWLNPPPYTITCKYDFEKVLEIWRVDMHLTPEPVPLLLGDFICCLRSSLDQLAWGLAHLDSKRVFSRKEQREICFLIFREDDATYRERRKLFPPAIASIFDTLQPYLLGNAFRDDPLWQLNELWLLDKHRSIPVNSHSLNVRFPMHGWESYLREFDNGFEVPFPLKLAWLSPVDLKPSITLEVLFGEWMGAFEVSLPRLREINEFVSNDVIPRFAGFFP